jgi:hypothetical protein
MTPDQQRAATVAEVEAAFPPIAKPPLAAITAHASGCFECGMLQEELSSVGGPWLPDSLVRSMHQQLWCISTEGLRWVLPSYLRKCLQLDTVADPSEIEFLVYQLAPKEAFRNDVSQRWGGLDLQQLRCLSHFLDWVPSRPHWSEWPQQIAEARLFVQSLVDAAGRDAV